VELYLQSPNTPSWCGAQLKHRDNFTFICKCSCMIYTCIHSHNLTIFRHNITELCRHYTCSRHAREISYEICSWTTFMIYPHTKFHIGSLVIAVMKKFTSAKEQLIRMFITTQIFRTLHQVALVSLPPHKFVRPPCYY